MKNIQVVDGAINCYYPIYAISDEKFSVVFPNYGQNLEFVDDLISRWDKNAPRGFFKDVWPRLLDKPDISGIHGTLFYELPEKKKFCPFKREPTIVGRQVRGSAARSWKNVQIISGESACFYPIYEATNEEFSLLFPEDGQDVEFDEDVRERLDQGTLRTMLENIQSRQVEKRDVAGLHGTLFVGLRAEKKEFYPTKRDRDISG